MTHGGSHWPHGLCTSQCVDWTCPLRHPCRPTICQTLVCSSKANSCRVTWGFPFPCFDIGVELRLSTGTSVSLSLPCLKASGPWGRGGRRPRGRVAGTANRRPHTCCAVASAEILPPTSLTITKVGIHFEAGGQAGRKPHL